MGLIKHETITKCLTNKPQIILPDFPPEQIEGLKRCFPLYVKFPKSRWKDIERAEKLSEEGNKIYQELRAEHIEKYFPKVEEDLTGRGDPTIKPYISDDVKKGYADEIN